MSQTSIRAASGSAWTRVTSRATPHRQPSSSTACTLVSASGWSIGRLAHPGQRAAHGDHPGQRDEVHPHQAAGAGAGEAHQRQHLLPLAGRQQVQDRLPALLRQLGDRVRGVVGAHPGQHLGDLEVGAGAEQPGGQVLVELLEDVRLEFGVGAHPAEDLGLLFRRRALQQVGDLGRLEPADAGERAAQQRAALVPDQPLEVVPVADAAP